MTLICFDLDGVILDAREIHYQALNRAAEFWSDGTATREEHLRYLDGLPTLEKLKWFTRNKGTPPDTWGMIYTRKQEITQELLSEIEPDVRLAELLNRLQVEGHILACVSNSIDATVDTALERLGIREYFTYVSGTTGLKRTKPHPECFLRAMVETGYGPSETLIVEDSPPGREAAIAAGAMLLPVGCPEDVTYDAIAQALSLPPAETRWQTDWQIVVPMAGAGTRFADAGYTFPKPLVDVAGRPMIQAALDSLRIDGDFIFLAQKEHIARYSMESLLHLLRPKSTVIPVDELTEGAACTVALAESHLDVNRPVLVVNSDQVVRWDVGRFIWSTERVDGLIATHTATHPKWSFVELDQDEKVTRVVEKDPISSLATVGIYWWRSAELLLRSIDEMIASNDRTNGEFYLAPTYNYAITSGAEVRTFSVDRMHGVGTPEDLQEYLRQIGIP